MFAEFISKPLTVFKKQILKKLKTELTLKSNNRSFLSKSRNSKFWKINLFFEMDRESFAKTKIPFSETATR